MKSYSLENIDKQIMLLNSIKEDYLYNFSRTINKPLIGPHMLQLVLTTKCNLRCKMCGVWAANEEELETFYVKKAIDDAYRMGNLQEVYFTGGEVLLRPDIFSLVKYVKDYYQHIRTHLNTNGVILDKKTIDRLIDVGLDTLGISIDSPEPQVHNALRGEKVLEKVMEAIDYINAEKKRRGMIKPLLDTCSVLMEQTLDTMYGMLDFCVKYSFAGIHIQPYVCNSDLRGKRDDGFWIHAERLPRLREVLDMIEAKKGKLPLHIEIPGEKIYNYFSKPVYVDKCYAGFTRALIVGKKINFVCNGPNNEKYQHFGVADTDSLYEVWSSDKAGFFRNTIKSCRRNCVQFCSIRPSSDSIDEIHRRLLEHNNLFLVLRELHFLKEHRSKYPELALENLIILDEQLILENLEVLKETMRNLESGSHFQDTAGEYLRQDLGSIGNYSGANKNE